MDSQWLKVQFDLNPDKSKADLAKALGLEPPAISKILNGSRQIKAVEHHEMRRYFGLPVDGEHATKLPDSAYRLETLSGNQQLSEGDKNTAEDWIIPADVLSVRTKAPSHQIKIFTVQENLMEPDYRLGEHVLVDLSDNKPSPPGAFVISDGHGHMIRFCEFVLKTTPTDIKVSAKNDGFQSQILQQADFNLIGRVIAKLQWV